MIDFEFNQAMWFLKAVVPIGFGSKKSYVNQDLTILPITYVEQVMSTVCITSENYAPGCSKK